MVGGAVPLAVYRGGDLAAGPLTLSRHAVSPQLKAISLEYSHAELATATANFHPSKRLGAGCYGAVYRGELKDGSDVAIKAIDLSILIGKGDCPQDAGFDEEVQLLSKFRHPHLVTLLGWGQHGLHRYLVYEFLSGGDVFQRLHKSKRGLSFPWHERLSVLLDAASGLSHMHNATPKAFHRDIKSANILLDRHHTAKMADFGLACTSLHGASNVAVKSIGGTPGYKCPVYERSGCCTEGSEVYSFGMVMLEVLTGLAPSATDQTVPGGISFPIAEKVAPQQPGALERMRGGDSTAEWPPALFKELATMALRCVDASERLRPHFVDLVRFLKSLAGRFPKTEFAVAMATMATMAPAVPGQVMSSRAPATPMSGRIATRQFEPRLCQSETKPLVVEDGCDGRHFVLELQESAACKIEALSSEWRWLPLVSEGHCAVVGRHLQQALFEAWLPCPQHACISRRAIEIYWDPNGEAKLVACGSNPVLVDGVQVEKGAGGAARLLPGSEICFAYDGKVLLRLRYLAFESCSFTPQWSLECSRRLAADDLERWRIPMLPGVSSVTEAVDRLNSGKAKCSDGLCIVFCPADCQYFLLYRKGCKAAALAAREGTGPRRSLAWTPPEEAFCELRCLQAEGMTRAELQALPLEHREMPVPLGYSFIKTEVLLREPSNDPQSLHGLLQLHAEPKVLSLTMLQRRAGVAVYIDEEELVPGFARRLQQGQVLIVVEQDGSTQRTVLVLQVHWFYEPDKVSSTAGPVTTRQTRGTDRSVPTLNSPSQKSLQPRSTAEIQRFRSEPGGVLPPPRCRAKQGESEVEAIAAASPQGDPSDLAPAVFLEISGSSAKDLPVAQRRLGPMTLRNQPWIIGRRHQKEFLQRTVKEESLEFISRDHFAIAYREGSFLLLALSQNRIWVDRGKVGIRSLQQDEMMPLRPGDRILLGTAPDDATSTRDSKARLDWLFQIQEQN